MPIPFWQNPLFWVKVAGAAIVAIAISWFYFHYKHLSSEAAKVPALESRVTQLTEQHARDDSRAAKAAIDLIAAQRQRDDAITALTSWRKYAQTINPKLEEMIRNAAATKLDVCRPTVDERQLWNSTLDQLIANGRTQ